MPPLPYGMRARPVPVDRPGAGNAIQTKGSTVPQSQVTPWGMSQLAPYPNTAHLPHSRIDIDPATQTSRYFTADGHRLDMPKHGTGTDTASQTQTGGDSGGKNPAAPQDDDLVHDTDSD